jgi:hypothetical protein
MNNNLNEKPEQSNNKQPVGYAIIPKIMVEQLKTLSGSAFKVYVAIYSFKPNKDGENKECYPSVDSIIERSGLSEVTVKLALRELKNSKVLIIQKKGRGNKYLFPVALTEDPTTNPQIKVNSSQQKAAAPPHSPQIDKETNDEEKPSGSRPQKSKESQADYMKRKQQEYPNLDVEAVYKKFYDFHFFNKLTPKRIFFDKWIAEEEEPMIVEPEQVEAYLARKDK